MTAARPSGPGWRGGRLPFGRAALLVALLLLPVTTFALQRLARSRERARLAERGKKDRHEWEAFIQRATAARQGVVVDRPFPGLPGSPLAIRRAVVFLAHEVRQGFRYRPLRAQWRQALAGAPGMRFVVGCTDPREELAALVQELAEPRIEFVTLRAREPEKLGVTGSAVVLAVDAGGVLRSMELLQTWEVREALLRAAARVSAEGGR